MKKLILLALTIPLVGCASVKYTYQCARIDWHTFKSNVKFYSKEPVIYNCR